MTTQRQWQPNDNDLFSKLSTLNLQLFFSVPTHWLIVLFSKLSTLNLQLIFRFLILDMTLHSNISFRFPPKALFYFLFIFTIIFQGSNPIAPLISWWARNTLSVRLLPWLLLTDTTQPFMVTWGHPMGKQFWFSFRKYVLDNSCFWPPLSFQVNELARLIWFFLKENSTNFRTIIKTLFYNLKFYVGKHNCLVYE